ncbi:MAG: carboxypeptidase-like regulatory domain-containing protein, partial [Candidatus Eisenbacteria bacterium]
CYWPTVLGGLLLLLVLLAVFARPSSAESRSRLSSLRCRNRDGAFLLASLFLLFLLVLFEQVAARRALLALETARASGAATAAELRKENQEWSLRYSEAARERDAIRSRWEQAEETEGRLALRGKVADRRSGAPLAGARVDVTRRDPAKMDRERAIVENLRTDEGGRFETLVPELGPKGAFRITVRADGYEPVHEWVTPGEGPLEVRILLSR